MYLCMLLFVQFPDKIFLLHNAISREAFYVCFNLFVLIQWNEATNFAHI